MIQNIKIIPGSKLYNLFRNKKNTKKQQKKQPKKNQCKQNNPRTIILKNNIVIECPR